MNTHDTNTWAKYSSWQKVTPPSRPDIWQLKEISKLLEKIPVSSAIAVLGSTIEIRDLLAERNYKNVFVFERNRGFYDYITTYMKFERSEQVIEGNWLDTISSFHNCFSAVFSDLTSGNVAYSDREQFYKNISQALSPDGIFVDRILIKPCPFIPFENLIEKYRNLEVTNATVNSFNCEVLFCSSLLENEGQIVDSSRFYDELLKLNIPQISEFVYACYEVTPRDCVWWYSKPWNIEREIYEMYLDIIFSHDEPENSEYFARCKLLISMRKGEL